MQPIRRIVLEQDHDCDYCQCPLMPGEIAFRDDSTGATGCSIDCAHSASEALVDHHEIACFRAGFELNLIGGVA